MFVSYGVWLCMSSVVFILWFCVLIFVLFSEGVEMMFKLFYCWLFSDSVGVCNVMCWGNLVELFMLFVVFFWNNVSYCVLFSVGRLSLMFCWVGNGGIVWLFVV